MILEGFFIQAQFLLNFIVVICMKILRLTFFLFALGLFFGARVSAQRPDLRDQKEGDKNMNGVPDDQEDLEDGDEDEQWESQTPRPVVAKFPEVKIIIDGKEKKISEDFVAYRNKVMSIQVKQLLPQSWIEMELEKVGVGLTKTKYQANELGELDLEVKTGKAKGKASVIFKYFSSDGKAHRRKIFVRID